MGLVYKNWVTSQGERTDNSSNFSSMADFNEAGGPSAFGDVPVWVGNQLRKNGSLLINPVIPALAEYDDSLKLTDIADLTWTLTASGTTAEISELSGRTTLKLSTPATAGLNAYGSATIAEDLTDYDYVEFAVFAEYYDELSVTTLGVFLFTDSNNYFWLNNRIEKPGWNIFRMAKSAFTINGSPNWNNITSIRLRLNSHANGIRTVHYAHVQAIKASSSRAAISLNFDDGDASQIYAARLMASRGIKGTFFVIRALLDSSPAWLTTDNVIELLELGHEVGVHGGYGGYDNWRTEIAGKGYAQFVADYQADITYLKALGADVESASYPQGIFTSDQVAADYNADLIPTALRELGIKYCRTTLNAWYQSANNYAQYSKAFPRSGLLISGGLTLSNANNLAAIKTMIDNAILSGGYHNIYGHVLAATAADGVTWAKSDFIELIDYLAAKRDAGLLDVRPFGEVSRELERNGYLTTSAES